jgi:hypothetical protein
MEKRENKIHQLELRLNDDINREQQPVDASSTVELSKYKAALK